jgi:alkanesulfonate monooxygenase SsuD/methylene tetrahydromethanopterin reductase-like flavin-dependent oxidoreductase (luciferase family)
MDLRVFTEPQEGATYDQLLSVARTAEECGFDAFFRSDHYLKMDEMGVPAAYTDAWTTLAGLARDTRKIRLGTLVTPVTFRPIGSFPVVVSQVDHMSDGRIEVGLGAGWYEQEHQSYGLAFPPTRTRHDLLEDQLKILHGVWSAPRDGVFDYKGPTVTVHIEKAPLTPLQRPHPPLIVGGAGGPRNAGLAAAYADEYNAPFVGPGQAAKAYRSVRRSCEESGRDPGTIVLSAANVVCCGRTGAELARRADAIGRELGELRQTGIAGTPAESIERLREYANNGAQRVYLQLLDLSDLDQLRLIADEVMPYV